MCYCCVWRVILSPMTVLFSVLKSNVYVRCRLTSLSRSVKKHDMWGRFELFYIMRQCVLQHFTCDLVPFSFIGLHCFCLQASHRTHSLLILTTSVDKQRSGAKYTWPWQTNGGHPAGVWHLHPWSWISASADNAWRVWQCLWTLGEDHCSTFK